MNGCYYICVNGQLELVTGNCTTIPCAQNGGACSNEGAIIFKKCTPPLSVEETKQD